MSTFIVSSLYHIGEAAPVQDRRLLCVAPKEYVWFASRLSGAGLLDSLLHCRVTRLTTTLPGY